MGLTLVTGASGFVGTHLIQEMRKRGLPVRGVSRQKRPGLVTIPSYGPEVDWIAHLADVDVVVHLAARVHVMREISKDPLTEFRAANVDATVNLARQAAQAGVKRFVFVSTIKVNGESTEPGKPFAADAPPNPQDPYAISKAEAEAALMSLGRETGMEIVTIRPPLVYGPGVGGNFRSLVKWAQSGLPDPFGKINNKRSLVYVGNLCDLLIEVVAHPAAANRTLLVADAETLSTNELLATLTAASGRTRRSFRWGPSFLMGLAALAGQKQAADRLLSSLQVDCRTTCEALNWTPPFTSDEGLRRTVTTGM